METKNEVRAAAPQAPEWLRAPRAPTDTELIDFLQALTDEAQYTGRVVLRDSTAGRGWRLHETSKGAALTNVRQAIIRYVCDRFGYEP